MEPSANKSTFEYHETLNPKIWEGETLRPEVKEKLLDITNEFLDSLELDIDVEDLVLTGSLANYNYTKYSDVDLHIITNFRGYKMGPDLLEDYFDTKKTNWNVKHTITIRGFEVEMYIQDTESLADMKRHQATGIYSLKTDTWLTQPVKIAGPDKIDTIGVEKKKKNIINMIEYALSDKSSYAVAKEVKEKILRLRQAGLDRAGEYSPENLAFKELRRTGYVEKLVLGIIAKKDKELSLAETFKQMFSMGKERGPRHRSLTAGVRPMTRATNSKGGIPSARMIAKSHTDTETPFPKIERLKAKSHGIEPLTPQEAQGIAAFYDFDLETAKTKPRGLSTSGIQMSFNPRGNVFMLIKGDK